MKRKLTDLEAHERLVDASNALGSDECETAHAATALKAARSVLVQMQIALLTIAEKRGDEPQEPHR